MLKYFLQKSISLFVFFLYLTIGFGQIPSGYYDATSGKTGDVLRATLRDITTANHVKLSYSNVWSAYAYTDVRPAPNNTTIWDMYSDKPAGTPDYTYTLFSDQCGNASGEGSCYSREHCMPNSWWGGIDNSANPQYTDLHHLFACDQFVNMHKSNYPIGQTTAYTYISSNGSKVGPSSYQGYTGTVFEPINEYKGDFARAWLYMATRYMNVIGSWVINYPNYDSQYVIDPLTNNFKPWFINMLLSWCTLDPVSQKEIDRNNAIYYNTIQHNRNPYIDHPEYICQVWSTYCVSAPTIGNISTTPAAPTINDAVTISAGISDNGSISSVTLYWDITPGSFSHSVPMSVSSAPTYTTTSAIPIQDEHTIVYYKIIANDNEMNETSSDVFSYTVSSGCVPENPINIFTETLGTVSSTTTIVYHENNNGFDNDTYTMGSLGCSNAADIRATSFSTGYTGASGSANVWFTSTNGEYGFSIAGINTSSKPNLSLSFAVRKENGSGTAFATLVLDYSLNGSTWTGIAFSSPSSTDGAGWYSISNISLPAEAQTSNLYLRWRKTGSIACRVDDITLSYAPDPYPIAYSVTGGGSYCTDGTGVEIGLSNSQTGKTYQLRINNTNAGTPISGTDSAISFGNQTTVGNYTVVATNTTTACTTTMIGNTSVSINPKPTAFNVEGGGSYCNGGSGIFIGLDGSQSGVNYQLKIDGINSGSLIPGNDEAISFGNQTIAGSYTVEAINSTTSCIISMNGNASVSINPAKEVSCVISSNKGTTINKGSTVKFTAVPTNGGLSPSYQWKVNGSNRGTGLQTYTTSTLHNSDVVTCVVTSSETCTSNNPATSNALTMTVNKKVELTMMLEGLYYSGTNQMFEAIDGNTEQPKYGAGIADAITIELHSSTAPYSMLKTIPDLMLHTNGLVTFYLEPSFSEMYYVVVKHLGSIETWTASPVSFTSETISYNFTTSASNAFGDNLKLSGFAYVIYGGDVNSDGIIDLSDMLNIENLAIYATVGTYPEDVNGDGLIDMTDMLIVENNSMYAVSVMTP